TFGFEFRAGSRVVPGSLQFARVFFGWRTFGYGVLAPQSNHAGVERLLRGRWSTGSRAYRSRRPPFAGPGEEAGDDALEARVQLGVGEHKVIIEGIVGAADR